MNFLERALDGKNQFWRYLIVIGGTLFVINIIGGIPMYIALFIQILKTGEVPVAQSMTDLSFLGVSQNMAFFMLMFTFVVGLFCTILLIKALHNRSFAETVNGTKKVRWNRSLFGFGIWFVIMLVYFAIGYYLEPEVYTFQFDIKTFIPLFLLAILMIPMQTTYEELTFRGYLSQGIAGWTKNRWLAVIIPGTLFGLMHFANPEIQEFGFWQVMPQYILYGLIWGLISVLDDGIELAMGVHAANNIFGCLILTHDASALQVPALFSASIENSNSLAETGILFLMGAVFIFICMKKYNWNWAIMNKKVEKIENKQDTEVIE